MASLDATVSYNQQLADIWAPLGCVSLLNIEKLNPKGVVPERREGTWVNMLSLPV